MWTILRPQYVFTITHEPDADYRKYLARQLRAVQLAPSLCSRAQAQALDISLDDEEGDVVAGIAAVMDAGRLYIDMLWVQGRLRGKGFGRRLMQMAEDEAARRGCAVAYASVSESALPVFQTLGYSISGRLQDFRSGLTFYCVRKMIAQADSAQKDLA
jgi:GNAT superfamily N-acetyltransferase